MTSKVLNKRSVVPGKVPTTAQIDLGELAINTRDGKLFLKRDNGNGTFTIVEIGSPQAVATSLGLGALAYGQVGDWTVMADASGNLPFYHDGAARDPPPLKWSSAMFRKTEETHGKQATKARRDCHEVTTG